MDEAQAQAWEAMFAAAFFLGQEVVSGVKNLAQKQLSAEDYAALGAKWQSDVDESAKNAGIVP